MPPDTSDDRPPHLPPDDLPAGADDEYFVDDDTSDAGYVVDDAYGDLGYVDYEYDLNSDADDAGSTFEERAPADVQQTPARSAPLADFSAGVWSRLRWAIFAGAFLTPLLVIVGLLLALDALDGESSDSSAAPPVSATLPATAQPAPTTLPTQPENADWPQNVVYIPHSVPARIRDVLATTSTKHGYLFEGVAGETWQIDVSAYQGSSATPVMMLFGPNGNRICQDPTCAGEPRASITITLNDAGPYRLVVESTGGTGLYLFTLAAD